MCITEKESGNIGIHKILREVKCKKKKKNLVSSSLKGLGIDGRLSIELFISAFALSYLPLERERERVGRTPSTPGYCSLLVPVEKARSEVNQRKYSSRALIAPRAVTSPLWLLVAECTGKTRVA